MEPTTEDIQSNIDKLIAEISEWKKERVILDQKINASEKEKEAWQFILSRRTGDKVTDFGGVLPSLHAAASSEVGEYGSKGKMIKEYVLTGTGKGISPKEVVKHMGDKGIPVSLNFVYKILNQLRDEGKVIADRDGFKPVVKSILDMQPGEKF